MSSDQHMKKLKSLREGLHVVMQCYMRQHFADRYKRCNQNPMSMYVKQRVSSQTVGESKLCWRATWTSTGKKFGRETG